jgi:hypothetical protein
LIGDGTGFTAAALSGDVTMTNAGVVTIANTSVELAMMAANSIDSDQYVDASIDDAHIADMAASKLTGTVANARLDAQLQDVAGLAVTDSGFIVGNGSNFVLETGATLRTSMGVGTGNDVQFDSFGVGTAASGTTGEIRATNNITAYYSDDRLKDRKGNIEDALGKINSLNGFNYSANETAQELGYEVKPEVGLSAQEVQKVLPEVVVPAPIDDKYLTIHYDRVVPLLVEAIKELSAKVEKLEGN